MPRLTPCPSCHGHVSIGERECPHCGTALHTTTAARASVVLLGLTLAGCPSDDEGASASETMTSLTVGSSSGPTTDGSATVDNTATLGEADYGVAETGPLPEDGTDTTTGEIPTEDSSSGGSSSGGDSSGSGTSTTG